jgi:hypothetical protein
MKNQNELHEFTLEEICRLTSSNCRRFFVNWLIFLESMSLHQRLVEINFHRRFSLNNLCRRIQSVAARRAQSRRGGISKNGRKVWSKATALESSQNWVGVMDIFS